MTKPARLALIAAALAASTLAAAAAERRPVVVELFTSQGCSSCPPANANLITLSRRPDVLALSFSVTYWDRLGWKDVFGKPEFTDRQETYEPALGQRGPFTPQIVVDGRASAVGQNLSEVEGLISASRRSGGPDLTLDGAKVAIGKGGAPAGGADVWLVRYDPGVSETPVRRGENAGRTLAHAHVVRELRRLGGWSGAAATIALPRGPEGLRTAILVQGEGGGPILAAATD